MTREFSLHSRPPRVVASLVRWVAISLLLVAFQSSAHAQALTSFVDASGRHGIYSGNDFHVHQAFCASACDNVANWVNQDLTAMAGAPVVGNYNSFASFSDGSGEHVFFEDSAQHLHQLRFAAGAWSNVDLGVISSSGVSGYSANGVARVFYETSAQHIHMLVSTNGTSWSDTDLTSVTGGTLAAWTSLTGFHDGAGEHIFYVATNGHLNQIYSYFISYYICSPLIGCRFVRLLRWANQDVTALGNAPLASTVPLSSYSDSFGEHVLYGTSNQHLHQLTNSGSGWADLDLSLNAPLLYFGLVSFSDNFGERVFYVAYDLNIYEPGNGSRGNLTAFAGGSSVWTCGGYNITAFGKSVNGGTFEDVFYVANDDSLHRISLQPGISATDQSLTGGQPFGSSPRNFCIQ